MQTKILLMLLLTAGLLLSPSTAFSQNPRPKLTVFWVPGQTVKIKFLNGSRYFQKKVKRYATEWTQYANLKFEFVKPTDWAHIKIGFQFDGDPASWSTIGRHATRVHQEEPSMNFGWFTKDTEEEEFRRVILHEFGHALGLHHEHQHPHRDITFKQKEVYRYYWETHGWDQEMVDYQVFNTKQNPYKLLPFDKLSIMMYPLPGEVMYEKNSYQLNTTLSHFDKLYMRLLYPSEGPSLKSFREETKPPEGIIENQQDVQTDESEPSWLPDPSVDEFYSEQMATSLAPFPWSQSLDRAVSENKDQDKKLILLYIHHDSIYYCQRQLGLIENNSSIREVISQFYSPIIFLYDYKRHKRLEGRKVKKWEYNQYRNWFLGNTSFKRQELSSEYRAMQRYLRQRIIKFPAIVILGVSENQSEDEYKILSWQNGYLTEDELLDLLAQFVPPIQDSLKLTK